MTTTPTGACQYGATPNSNGQAAQYVWVSLATYAASRLPEWTRLQPWVVGAIADRVVNVEALCNSNPAVPDPITPADIVAVTAEPIVGIGLPQQALDKIVAALYYDAFRTLCNCTTGPGVCVPTTIAVSTATNATYQPASEGYWWPTTTTGISANPAVVNYPWPFACNTVDIFVDSNPHLDNLVINPLHIYDCAGVDHGAVTQAGATARVTLSSCPSDATKADLHLLICTFDGGGRPNWTVKITPVGNAGTGPQPPAQGPDTTTGIPGPPAPHCDATGACNIQWAILNRLQQDISVAVTTNNNVLEGGPTTYAAGNSYTLSGQGVQVVAQDTLGVVVQLSVIPAQYVPTASDPPRYYDIGWIQLGAGDAIDGKKWIHSSGDRFIPAFPEVDRCYYNLAPGVTIVLTELVPPAPTP